MIIAYDKDGKEVGRYDTASDLWADYPDAEVRGGKAVVKEPGRAPFFIFTAIKTDTASPALLCILLQSVGKKKEETSMEKRETRYAWAERVLKMYFTSPVYVGEDDGCPVFEVENTCNRTLKLIIWDINNSMHSIGYYAHFSVYGNPVLDNVDSSRRGIKVKWINVWESDICDLNGWKMNCIVRQSVNGHIPYDDLSKVNLCGENIDALRYQTEDGVGIEAKDIGFNAKIEAIQYCNEVPYLWCYTGEIGGFRFQGLASEFGLALGKAIKAAYRGAKKWEMQTIEGKNVADLIENNDVRWHKHGYCY